MSRTNASHPISKPHYLNRSLCRNPNPRVRLVDLDEAGAEDGIGGNIIRRRERAVAVGDSGDGKTVQELACTGEGRRESDRVAGEAKVLNRDGDWDVLLVDIGHEELVILVAVVPALGVGGVDGLDAEFGLDVLEREVWGEDVELAK